MIGRELLAAHDVPLFSVAGSREKAAPTEIVRFSITLHESEIATLQGHNQSGKTLIIKSLTGLVPTAHGRPISLRLCGAPVEFRSPADAVANGVVAVFQDDEMIPHMTVRQQLRMRHAARLWEHLGLINVSTGDIAKKFGERMLRSLPGAFKLRPPSVGDDAEVDALAIEILGKYGKAGRTSYLEVLDRRPQELSGGAKAVARLVSAQMTPGIRVLLLDEIFRGVHADVWPAIVDSLSEWAHDKHAAILSVTHISEEVVRWRPSSRYQIDAGMLRRVEPSGHQALVAGVPQRSPAFPVYRNHRFHDVFESLNLDTPVVLAVDKGVVDLEPYSQLRDAVRARYGQASTVERVIETNEIGKSWAGVTSLLSLFAECLPLGRGTVVVIGGGVHLNYVSFVASILHRGMPCVVVPTTVMAMADVAIGSKTSVNLELGSEARKHLLGTYWNPTAVVIDERFIAGLSKADAFIGISECLKHGLLQDKSLVEAIVSLANYNGSGPWNQLVADISWRTMLLKSQVLLEDPWETRGLGFLLLYGHLHAHSLERASKFSLPHGIAVYLGLMVETKLAGQDAMQQIIKTVIEKSGLATHPALRDLIDALKDRPQFEKRLRLAYQNDPKPQHHDGNGGFTYLHLQEIGGFATATSDEVAAALCSTTFDEIVRVTTQTLLEVGRLG